MKGGVNMKKYVNNIGDKEVIKGETNLKLKEKVIKKTKGKT